MTVETVNGGQVAVPQAAVAKVPVTLAQPLADLDQAWRAAGILARSRLLPESLIAKNPEQTQANVTMILWYGAELGLPPMQAIQSIYVVNGRPSMSGQLWLSKVREAGHKAFVACQHCDEPPEGHPSAPANDHRYQADHDTTRCTLTIVRGDSGARHSETFTIEEARQAGLATKNVWKSWPKRMLMWRAVTNCATTICPEVAMGYGDELPEPAESGESALARAVDARQPAAAPAVVDDVADAEIVDDEAALAAADEAARQELAEMAAQHEPIDEPSTEFPCEDCDPAANHSEVDCPKRVNG